MRQLDVGMQSAAYVLNAPEPFAWLAGVQLPTDPETWLRVNSTKEPVSHLEAIDGTPVVWRPYPMTVGVIRATNEGDLTQIQVAVDAGDGQVMQYLEDYDGLDGQQAELRLVNLSYVNNENADILFKGEVSLVESGAKSVTFTIGSKSIKKILFPGNRFQRDSCIFPFGGTRCGHNLLTSSFAAGDCTHTLGFCKRVGADELANGVTVNHPLRIGLFPGISNE